MASPPDDRALVVALRMKAARWLAGRADDQGKPIALPVSELAEDPELAQNRIGRNRLEEIEQMRVTARPMELDKIAAALGMPADWFVAGPPGSISDRLDSIEARLDDLASSDYLRRMGEALDTSRERETGSSPGSAPGQGRP